MTENTDYVNEDEKILKIDSNHINYVLLKDYWDSSNVLKGRNHYNFEDVKNFLSVEIEDKGELAERLIKEKWKTYGKEDYGHFFDKLLEIESGIKMFNESHRDHIIHSANVFLLGIYFFMEDRKIKEHFKEFNQSCLNIENLFVFMWSIISTFHDIGYPFQGFSKQMKDYMADINKLGAEMNNYRITSFEIVISDLDILSDGRSSFDILNQLQSKHDINDRFFNLERYFKFKLKNGSVDHGIISSLFLLKITDTLYFKKRWNKEFFDKVFPEIALAIALHNIEWPNVIEEMKVKKKDLPEITLCDFPFCYLLTLADTLQEWDRPKEDDDDYLPSDGVSIVFDKVDERFIVEFALSKKRISEIEEELENKISTTDEKKLPRFPALEIH